MNRKQYPLFSGLLKYFPDALMEVAHTSWIGNEQHNPGEPLHWDRNKSSDQMDACIRHILDYSRGDICDTDGAYHLSKAIWRCMAELQLLIEKNKNG